MAHSLHCDHQVQLPGTTERVDVPCHDGSRHNNSADVVDEVLVGCTVNNATCGYPFEIVESDDPTQCPACDMICPLTVYTDTE